MKFTIKQIAAQAGVSKATIDRALHGRGSVHAQTQRRINQAIRDLELQERTSLATGRTIPFDVILHTPERFSRLVCDALIDEMSHFASFQLRLRFHCVETISTSEMRKLMLKCANDSYGIILKAENNAAIGKTIEELQKYRVPVVTIVTDVPDSARLRYVGMDNISAGMTAAYLMSQWVKNTKLDVAVVLSSQNFLGEKERVDGFCQGIKQMMPSINPVWVSEGYGVDGMTFDVMLKALKTYPNLKAVYCVGGGNAAILRAFHQAEREIISYIGHDVDEENRFLLSDQKLNAVIQHDLQSDARVVFRTLLTFHGFLPVTLHTETFSKVNVVTPYNL
ncbi:LacI family DNA-binding transcriptional regulator [Candidatus Pantoea multigeneris]|uniref:LacI family transcriptional regulator n=1 Tax=Candidatus Pantoea multigeneris TaxID=2608357 RepID=A0ABX0RES7_9GAMM|nr:LacI family DNA-binding transcriptional regulator [Pantoea multigeneris]NIF23851.1 LacI family transcriptional regulator [Pantoea multigeneris]